MTAQKLTLRTKRPSSKADQMASSIAGTKRRASSSPSETSSEAEQSDSDEEYVPRKQAKSGRQASRHRSSIKSGKKKKPSSKASHVSKASANSKKNKRAKTMDWTPAPTNTAGTGSKNEDLSSAVSERARLPQCDLGAIELLTFFPKHMLRPEANLRLHRNGWKSISIAKAQLFARNKLDCKTLEGGQPMKKRKDVNRKQVLENGKVWFSDDDFTVRKYKDQMTPVSTYDATNYAPKDGNVHLVAAKLVDIAAGVVYWPTGQDRGVFTQAVECAEREGLEDATTADVPNLIVRYGFQPPGESLGTQWDQMALARSEGRIEVSGNYRVNGPLKAGGFESEESGSEEDEDEDDDASE